MRIRHVAMAMLGLLLVSSASSTVFTLTEDYEDDSVGLVVDGENPNEPWYTFERRYSGLGNPTTCSTSNNRLEISTSGAISGLSLRKIGETSDTTYCNFAMILSDDFDITDVVLTWKTIHELTSCRKLYFIEFIGEANQLISRISNNDHTNCWTVAGSNDATVCINGLSADCTETPQRGLVCRGSAGTTRTSTFTFGLNKEANSITVAGTHTGCSSPVTKTNLNGFDRVKEIRVRDASDNFNQRNYWMDNWQVEGVWVGPIPTEDQGPPEFDTGLLATINALGFITPQSLLLFTIGLVGATTVVTAAGAKWLGSGRFKQYIIAGAGMVVAAFAILLAFLQLWVYLMAFVLAIFAIRGGGAVRNTFHEIRDRFTAEDPGSAVMGAATFTAEEPPPSEEGPAEDAPGAPAGLIVTEEASKTALSGMEPGQRATIQLDGGGED